MEAMASSEKFSDVRCHTGFVVWSDQDSFYRNYIFDFVFYKRREKNRLLRRCHRLMTIAIPMARGTSFLSIRLNWIRYKGISFFDNLVFYYK